MNKEIITTLEAPAAIGTYSQAVKAGNTIYLSGQIPLDPQSMTLVDGEVDVQIHRVFKNLTAVCTAAGGTINDIVKLTIYLLNLSCFSSVNEIMADYFEQPYPARAAIGVAELPKGASVEIDAVMVI